MCARLGAWDTRGGLSALTVHLEDLLPEVLHPGPLAPVEAGQGEERVQGVLQPLAPLLSRLEADIQAGESRLSNRLQYRNLSRHYYACIDIVICRVHLMVVEDLQGLVH